MRTRRRAKKTPIIITLLILIGLIFGSLYIFNEYFSKDKKEEKPTELNKEEESTPKKYSGSFTAAGNILVNSNMWYDTLAEDNTYDFTHVFGKLEKFIKKSNVNFYSAQSIIGGKELGLSAYYSYNSPVEVADVMVNMGFNMVSLASTHSYDKAVRGITNSINYWNGKKIAYSGMSISAGERLKNNIITKNEVAYGLLSYTMGTDIKFNDDYSVNVYSEELVKSDVEAIKNLVDVLVVSIDWHDIKSNDVTDKQVNVAKYLSSLGVDIVLGNTGFSIQPIETIDNTLVFYSMGNLLSGHVSVDSRISMIADFDVTLNKTKTKTSLTFSDVDVMLIYAYNKDNTNYQIIPFSEITTELSNYKTYHDKYSELLTNNKDYIKVDKLGEESGS